WYAREAEYLLPDGFSCPKCDGSEFTKETDILDVWFDSGSSSVAVLEAERGLPWPADVYLEGPDQYRGWFNSSLMVGLAAGDQAPYKTVVTHGWTVDGEGKAMHKSTGNAIPSEEVVGKQGAEIMRLWVASSDYQEDVRVEESEMWEIDRWALAMTRELTRKVVESYKRFDYTTVYHALYHYATVTLSNVYIDILKDRLYTYAPKSTGRRSAQTALYDIVDCFSRLLAPILVFTADEIWESLPGKREASVHISEFPQPQAAGADADLLLIWERLFEVRSAVQKALEEKRNDKIIGASLEAKVTLAAGGDTYELLARYEEQLASLFIVSQVTLRRSDRDELKVDVEHADGLKCERCWNWSSSVGA